MFLIFLGVYFSFGYLLVEFLFCFGNVVVGNNNDSKLGNLCNLVFNCEGNEIGIIYVINFLYEFIFLVEL